MSRRPASAIPAATPAYSAVCTRPRLPPSDCASLLVRAAHSGATALVPPITVCWPSMSTWYPVSGSALPATSGTPRPVPPAAGQGVRAGGREAHVLAAAGDAVTAAVVTRRHAEGHPEGDAIGNRLVQCRHRL